MQAGQKPALPIGIFAVRRFGRTVLDRQTPVYSNQRLCAVIRKQDVLILTERLHIHVGVDAVAVENMPVEVDCDIRTFRNGNRIVELIRSFPAHRLAVPNFEIAAEVAMQYDLLFYAVVAVRFFVGVLYRLLDGVERSKRIEFENCVVVRPYFERGFGCEQNKRFGIAVPLERELVVAAAQLLIVRRKREVVRGFIQLDFRPVRVYFMDGQTFNGFGKIRACLIGVNALTQLKPVDIHTFELNLSRNFRGICIGIVRREGIAELALARYGQAVPSDSALYRFARLRVGNRCLYLRHPFVYVEFTFGGRRGKIHLFLRPQTAVEAIKRAMRAVDNDFAADRRSRLPFDQLNGTAFFGQTTGNDGYAARKIGRDQKRRGSVRVAVLRIIVARRARGIEAVFEVGIACLAIKVAVDDGRTRKGGCCRTRRAHCGGIIPEPFALFFGLGNAVARYRAAAHVELRAAADIYDHYRGGVARDRARLHIEYGRSGAGRLVAFPDPDKAVVRALHARQNTARGERGIRARVRFGGRGIFQRERTIDDAERVVRTAAFKTRKVHHVSVQIEHDIPVKPALERSRRVGHK